MTIDPFAPIGSDRHPLAHANRAEDTAPRDDDAMPHWIRLPDEPVAKDSPDATDIGQQRWEEYRRLLDVHGTEEQQERMNARHPFDEQDMDMPTLADLRQADAAQTPPEGDELAAKLKAMEEAGL